MFEQDDTKWHGLKFLIPYLGKYKPKIIMTFGSMIAVASTTALSAYMMKPILNNIFIDKDEKMLWLIPLAVVVLFMIRGIFRYLSVYLATSIGIDITTTLRSQMFDKSINANYETLQDKTVADLGTNMIQTVLRLRQIIASSIPSLIISSFTIVALVGTVLYLNWQLAIYAIIFASVIVVPIKYLGQYIKRYTMNSEKMISALADRINEVFNNIDIVKVYNNTKYEQTIFDKHLENYRKFQLKLSRYKESTSPIMEFFVSIAIAFVIYSGGYAVINADMTAGDFFAFLTALMMLYAPIKVVTKNSIVMNMLDTYIMRIEKILNITQETKGLQKLNDDIISVEFIDVSLNIKEKTILENINIKIKQNDSVAIVGKTGAGKSSLLSLLFGFRAPTTGKILINGIDITVLDRSSVRDKISYVNQHASIFNNTIKENILYGLNHDETRYNQAKDISHCDFIEDKTDKDHEQVGEGGKKLSGGQRQRVAIARAIYKKNKFFVLDEATSALDANTEKKIKNSIEQIMSQNTSIVIAHRLNTIKHSNKIILLSSGKVVQIGDYETISNTPQFKKNFDI